MRLKNLNIAFFVTSGVSVLVFSYLVFLGYDEIKTLKDVIKIVASIMFPIPLLLFVRTLIIQNFKPENTDAYKAENQKPATILLVLSVIGVIVLLLITEFITGKKLENTLVIAHLINSTTISSYVLNYMLYNNLKVNGILSGVLLGLAIHVFFISA